MRGVAMMAFGLAIAMTSAAPAGTLDFYLSTARDVPEAGLSLALPRGQAVYVKLQRASGAGYAWSAAASSTIISVANIGSAKERPVGGGKKGMVGFPVFDIFRVSRVAPGAAEVDFALARSHGAPVQSRKLTLSD